MFTRDIHYFIILFYTQWKEGDSTPKSWFKFYCVNPCVPLDYSSIGSLMDALSTKILIKNGSETKKLKVQRGKIRILLSPGVFSLSEPIVINAINSSSITIETLQIPTLRLKSFSFASLSSEPIPESSLDSSRSSTSRLRRLRISGSNALLRGLCRSSSVQSIDPTNRRMDEYQGLSTMSLSSTRPSRATLILNTDRSNLPLIRVSRGKLQLNKIDLIHSCAGTDIWNGNAAVQVQPPLDSNGQPYHVGTSPSKPAGILNEVGISSFSGRGAVAIDGGQLVSRKCFVSDCAATGIYVGGPGSIALVEETDVLNNGHGNETRRRGIARGHSGVYLEQGIATLRNCNVSNNSLTGISAISNHNAFLTVENSDVKGNGTLQIELPPVGSISWKKSKSVNNYISQEGSGRLRSGLNQDLEKDILEDELLTC